MNKFIESTQISRMYHISPFLGHFHSSSLSFMSSTLFRITGKVSCKKFTIWVSLKILSKNLQTLTIMNKDELLLHLHRSAP